MGQYGRRRGSSVGDGGISAELGMVGDLRLLFGWFLAWGAAGCTLLPDPVDAWLDTAVSVCGLERCLEGLPWALE